MMAKLNIYCSRNSYYSQWQKLEIVDLFPPQYSPMNRKFKIYICLKYKYFVTLFISTVTVTFFSILTLKLDHLNLLTSNFNPRFHRQGLRLVPD